jgi:TPR repeat protein
MRSYARAIGLAAALIAAASSAAAQPDARALYNQLVAIEKQDESERDLAMLRGDVAAAVMGSASSAERFKTSLEIEQQLKDAGFSGDALAAFYWGLLKASQGAKFNSTGKDVYRQAGAEAFKEALSGFQVASRAGLGAASWNIATMYEGGLGVTQSALAAAEWYALAGMQYAKKGEREMALAALERVEKVDSRHPDAIQLRAQLFPKAKGRVLQKTPG